MAIYTGHGHGIKKFDRTLRAQRELLGPRGDQIRPEPLHTKPRLRSDMAARLKSDRRLQPPQAFKRQLQGLVLLGEAQARQPLFETTLVEHR